MKKYTVQMYNCKKERIEEYTTSAKDEKDLKQALSLFLDNGYELRDFMEIKST